MRLAPIPPEAQGRAFRASDLASAGVTRSRARRSGITHPHHGVYAVEFTDDDLLSRCERAAPILLPGQFFSHRTAAVLWGAALPTRHLGQLDISVLDPRTPPRRPGITGWRVSGIETRMLNGLPVASPADAWCQLGRWLRMEDQVAAGEALLPARRRPGVCTVDDLVAAAARHAGKRGMGVLSRALPLLRAGVDSRPETLLRLLLVRNHLPEPVIGVPIALDGLLLHPDLAYPDEQVAIEYDGDGHRTDQRQWQRDVERRERFEDAGWRVIRVTSATLFGHPAELVERVARVLAQRRRSPRAVRSGR